MNATEHMKQRMAQRGINREMVDLVLDFGTPKQDKFILGRDEAQEQLRELQHAMRVLKKILDKGGVTVVTEGDALITTYNCNSRRH
jgi:hypothetical protein